LSDIVHYCTADATLFLDLGVILHIKWYERCSRTE